MVPKRLTLSGLFFIGVLLTPLFAYSADFSISPESGSVGVGEEVSIVVKVSPGGEKINAADGTIIFDAALLSVARVSKEGSSFSLWTAEPSFSNSGGTVTFSGGTPSAFDTTGTVLTIVFKGKSVGSAKIEFSKGSVLAADGKGTDVYGKGMGGTLTVTEAAASAPEEEDVATVDDASPPLPVITSSTHPKPDSWYATSTGEFSWKAPSDITGVRTLFTDKEDGKATEVRDVAVVTQAVANIADGTWYFYVQFKNDFGWGETAQRKVLVDTVPPLEFDFSLSEGETPKFMLNAQDETSGIGRYEIVIGGMSPLTVRQQDIVDGGVPVPPQEGGPQSVTVKAFDQAGNVREVKKDLTLPKVEKPSAKSTEEEADAPPLWTLERILTILFALIIGALGSWIMYSRKTAQEDRLKVLQRIAEVADKNTRVFSAMREEFEQMVNDLDEKPQLTPAEREFLEKVKEVLDISEELTDAAIGELKRLIRGQ